MNLRALSIRQPWAQAIALGWKPVENRTWKTHHRGPVAIHAATNVGSKADFDQAVARVADLSGKAKDLITVGTHIRGAIIAIADLTDCCGEGYRRPFSNPGCDCGPWAVGHAYHFRLANIRPLTTPVLAKGQLGLWAVSDEAQEQITATLGCAA